MRTRTKLLLVLAALCAPWVALALAAVLTPLPDALRDRDKYGESIRVLDRHGELLRHVRSGDGAISQPVSLGELSPHVVPALLAAEDRRFFVHPGIDPLSMIRAAGQAIWNRRLVSGASTLTQQLARQVIVRPRTALGKLREMALALRIEASLDKSEILEEYLRRAPFGPNVRGIEAASRAYLDKPAHDLSLAEAAFLVSLPRGPTLYDPRRGIERPKRRRDRVIDRMASAGAISLADAERAKAEPIHLTGWRAPLDASHFVNAVTAGKLAQVPASAIEIATTLDPSLQREAETIARAAVADLASRHVTAASVVVLENATGDILAYVGSPDPQALGSLGANDGVLAKRQPGSSLKPFVYELALEELGWTAATIVPDVEMHLATAGGEFSPHDYDGRFHGPVRMREALASSYNVPAVYTAAVLGPDRVLDRLHALGFASLDQDADHYGAAIALGDGEVTLIELANAYATLARDGMGLPARAVRSTTHDGEISKSLQVSPTRVLSANESAVITSILSDDRARMASFGENGALALEFPVAAKTGTSKGFRDNIAVGFTREVTVAVWVGNFDGSAMREVSGISGAGPIFRDVMRAAMASRPRAELVTGDLEEVEVCSLSGERPGEACTHRRHERFVSGTAPHATCSMHMRVRVDARNGQLAGEGCAPSDVALRVVETYPPAYAEWARSASRPLSPEAISPRCPRGVGPRTAVGGAPRVLYPLDGAHFVRDDGIDLAHQRVVVRAEAADDGAPVRIVVDGSPTILRGRPLSLALPLVAGTHRVWAESHDSRSDEITFTVD